MAAQRGDFLGISITQFPLPFLTKVNHEGNENNTQSYEQWRIGWMEPTEAGWDFNFLSIMKTAFPFTAAVEIIYQWPPVISLSRRLCGVDWLCQGWLPKPLFIIPLLEALGMLPVSKGSAFVRMKNHGDFKHDSFSHFSMTFPCLIWIYDFLHVFQMPDIINKNKLQTYFPSSYMAGHELSALYTVFHIVRTAWCARDCPPVSILSFFLW